MNDLRWIAGVEQHKSYARFSNLKSQVLKPAIAALENGPVNEAISAIRIEVLPHRDSENGPVEHVRFEFIWRDLPTPKSDT